METAKSARLDRRVQQFLEPKRTHGHPYWQFVSELWAEFHALGMSDPDFVAAFISPDDEKRHQRVWEMMLGRHLAAQGLSPGRPRKGPDFVCPYDGRKIWIEAVCPSSRGLPTEWLVHHEGVFSVPHDEILLKWAGAFHKKAELRRTNYAAQVAENDPFVIAINGCQVAGPMGLDEGVSQWPLAVETVFPIGPIAFRLNGTTLKIEGVEVSERFAVVKANRSEVSTTPFLDPKYANISAVLGYAKDRSQGANLPAVVVHNPLAIAPLPFGILGPNVREVVAEPDNCVRGQFNVRFLPPHFREAP